MGVKDKLEHLTVDDCLKIYEREGMIGLVEKVKEISFKVGFNEALNTVVATKQYDEGREAAIREVMESVEMIREIGGEEYALIPISKLRGIKQ